MNFSAVKTQRRIVILIFICMTRIVQLIQSSSVYERLRSIISNVYLKGLGTTTIVYYLYNTPKLTLRQ